MIKFTITPFDVLFFGDAKPFNKGSDAASIFPPLPNTFASALFARMYYQKNIIYNNNNSLINAVYGPFLQKDDTIYFTAPMDLVQNGDEFMYMEYTQFQHNNVITHHYTDLADTVQSLLWLKGKSDKNIKPVNAFISLEGLKKWYNNAGLNKSDFLAFSDVYEEEERIGILTDDETRTTESQDGLYRVNFIRLHKGIRFVLWMDFNVDNLKNYFKNEDEILQFYQKEPAIVKLGGENKNAWYICERNDFHSLFDNLSNADISGGISKILFLTHAIFETENKPKNILKELPGFKTGIIGKYIIAGINSKNIGTKTVRAIPAGSVIYCDLLQGRVVDFYKSHKDFIGSNLVLKK